MGNRDLSCWLDSCRPHVFAGYTALYICYIGCGSLLFMAIEDDGFFEKNEELLNRLQTVKESFIKKFPNITGELLDNFVKEMTSAGLSQFQDETTISEPKWSFSQAVFFCVTLLTTIGYGHIAPVSRYGKAVCMVYTSLGIPLTIILMAGSVSRLMCGVRFLQNAFSSQPCCRRLKSPSLNLIFFALAFVLVGLLFFLIPAAIFVKLEENWSFLDAFYFCFISLTTVGLGDYVPGKQPNVQYITLYRICVSLYLLFGVMALAFLMSLATKSLQCLFFRNDETEESFFKQPCFKKEIPNYGSMIQEKVSLIKKSEDCKINVFYGQTT